MIGRIRGKLAERSVTRLLVDVGGVAYEIDIPLTTFYQLPADDDITLYTHLVVRDDAHQLFGFHSVDDRDLFRALIKVNGVGPRLALTILSGMESDVLAQCIRAGDTKSLVALPGIGKRTAERLILDLKDRVPELGTPAAGSKHLQDNLADAESALIGLGFKPQEAALALAQVEDDSADVATLIKQALKALG
ncbi:MAG TPA: Holliday junction branch migration protein RuvA [Pseudomonadales bacterium]|nr:Holliday junction branch migration protein RuvA [Pseudomonadales bacterium]